MAKILGVGIATLDIINKLAHYPAEDSETRALEQNITRGGNVTNTLTVLSQLHHNCYWTGTLADDLAAAQIKLELKKYSINTDYVDVVSNSSTPTSYIALNIQNGSRTIVHHRDLPELSFEVFEQIPFKQFDWIHFEARNIEQTIKMLEYLKQHHNDIPCSVEVEKTRDNIEHLFSYPSLLIFSKNYCIENNYNDAELFLSRFDKTNPDQSLVVGWGNRGAYSFSNKQRIKHTKAERVENIVDTVGAGDTFNAGLINALLSGSSIEDATRQANRLAAYKITQHGFDISAYDG